MSRDAGANVNVPPRRFGGGSGGGIGIARVINVAPSGGSGGAGAGIARIFTEPRCARFDPGGYERRLGGDPLLDAIKRADRSQTSAPDILGREDTA